MVVQAFSGCSRLPRLPWCPYSGLIVVSVLRIHRTSSSSATLSAKGVSSQAVPSASGMRLSAVRKASSEITFFMPSKPGLMPSHRIVVTCEERRCPESIDSIHVPSTSALGGALGLVS